MKRLLWLAPLLVTVTALAGNHPQHPGDARHAQMTKAPSPFVDYYAEHDGGKDAAHDLKAGRLTVLTFGLQASWSREYRQILQRDYGIELRAVAGCVVSESLVRYAHDYNEVMNRAISARHGKDLFERVVEQARATHAAKGSPGKS